MVANSIIHGHLQWTAYIASYHESLDPAKSADTEWVANLEGS